MPASNTRDCSEAAHLEHPELVNVGLHSTHSLALGTVNESRNDHGIVDLHLCFTRDVLAFPDDQPKSDENTWSFADAGQSVT